MQQQHDIGYEKKKLLAVLLTHPKSILCERDLQPLMIGYGQL